MDSSSRYNVLQFPFPILDVPASLASSEWARLTAGLDAEAVRNVLASHWPVPADPALARLRDKFLTYTPAGIVTYDLQDYLQLDHPDLSGESEAGDSYYLSPPIPLGEMREAVVAREGESTLPAGFIAFHAMFPGLREDFQTAGHFIRPGDWKTLAEEMEDDCDDLDQTGHWQDAIWIYHARNGDMLLLARTGAVAWYSIGENRITPVSDSFGEFLDHFRDHMDLRWPLDSCGPD